MSRTLQVCVRNKGAGAAQPSTPKSRPKFSPTLLQLKIAAVIELVPDTRAYRFVRKHLDLAFWAEHFRNEGRL